MTSVWCLFCFLFLFFVIIEKQKGGEWPADSIHCTVVVVVVVFSSRLLVHALATFDQPNGVVNANRIDDDNSSSNGDGWSSRTPTPLDVFFLSPSWPCLERNRNDNHSNRRKTEKKVSKELDCPITLEFGWWWWWLLLLFIFCCCSKKRRIPISITAFYSFSFSFRPAGMMIFYPQKKTDRKQPKSFVGHQKKRQRGLLFSSFFLFGRFRCWIEKNRSSFNWPRSFSSFFFLLLLVFFLVLRLSFAKYYTIAIWLRNNNSSSSSNNSNSNSNIILFFFFSLVEKSEITTPVSIDSGEWCLKSLLCWRGSLVSYIIDDHSDISPLKPLTPGNRHADTTVYCFVTSIISTSIILTLFLSFNIFSFWWIDWLILRWRTSLFFFSMQKKNYITDHSFFFPPTSDLVSVMANLRVWAKSTRTIIRIALHLATLALSLIPWQ